MWRPDSISGPYIGPHVHQCWSNWRIWNRSVTEKTTSRLSANSDCSQRHCCEIRLQWYCTNVASRFSFWTTYWTTSPSILVQLKNLKQIRDRENNSQLSLNSDCSQRHCCKMWHPDSISGPHIGPQVHQFWSNWRIWNTSETKINTWNFLPTQIICNSIASNSLFLSPRDRLTAQTPLSGNE